MSDTIRQSLQEAGAAAADRRITTLFDRNPARFAEFSVHLGDMLFDFSKVNIDARTLTLLIELAEACGVPARRDAMFRGERINTKIGRAHV